MPTIKNKLHQVINQIDVRQPNNEEINYAMLRLQIELLGGGNWEACKITDRITGVAIVVRLSVIKKNTIEAGVSHRNAINHIEAMNLPDNLNLICRQLAYVAVYLTSQVKSGDPKLQAIENMRHEDVYVCVEVVEYIPNSLSVKNYFKSLHENKFNKNDGFFDNESHKLIDKLKQLKSITNNKQRERIKQQLILGNALALNMELLPKLIHLYERGILTTDIKGDNVLIKIIKDPEGYITRITTKFGDTKSFQGPYKDKVTGAVINLKEMDLKKVDDLVFSEAYLGEAKNLLNVISNTIIAMTYHNLVNAPPPEYNKQQVGEPLVDFRKAFDQLEKRYEPYLQPIRVIRDAAACYIAQLSNEQNSGSSLTGNEDNLQENLDELLGAMRIAYRMLIHIANREENSDAEDPDLTEETNAHLTLHSNDGYDVRQDEDVRQNGPSM